MNSCPANGVDFNQRPRSYFWAASRNISLSSSIKGAKRKRLFEASLNGSGEFPIELLQPSLSDADRRAWESRHPENMGGEYLPDQEPDEVEIARIVIASTTQDVTSVYVSQVDGVLVYRVVDEY